MSGCCQDKSPLIRVDHETKRFTPHRLPLRVLLVDDPQNLVESLAKDFAVHRVKLTGIAPPNRCVAAIAVRLEQARVRRMLEDFLRRFPLTLLIIVTSGDRSNLKKLVGLNASDVVTTDGIASELPKIVDRLDARDLLETAAKALERDDTLHDLLRLALVTAFQTIPPIHSQKRLASLIGTKPNRLSEAFQSIQARTGWHWTDLLEVVALYRAMKLLPGNRTLKIVYEALGLSDRTMRRSCAKHLSCKPSQLLQRADWLEEAIANFALTITNDVRRKD